LNCVTVRAHSLAVAGPEYDRLARTLSTDEWQRARAFVTLELQRRFVAARGGLPEGIRVYPKPIPFDDLRNIVADLLARRVAYLEA
jgi:hypothetical protein